MPMRRRPALALSMNCTVTRPLPPPRPPPLMMAALPPCCCSSVDGGDGGAEDGEDDDDEKRSRTSEAVRWSMSVSSSGSAT